MARPSGPTDLDRVFREEHGRVVATLARRLGDIDVAEEAAQEAYLIALQRWPESGMPPNPGAWLTTTAYNRAIDRIRRESTRDARQAQAVMINDTTTTTTSRRRRSTDDRLRLMFTCCHPALATSTQVALTLRLLGGLTVAEIASAFLVDEARDGQAADPGQAEDQGGPDPLPGAARCRTAGRLRGVLATLFLVFNEGYLPTAASAAPAENGDTATDVGVPATAGPDGRDPHRPVRRGDPVDQDPAALMPDEPEVQGLLALMLLTDARRPGRFAGGALVTLADQDRTRWDRDLIAEGHAIVRALPAPGSARPLPDPRGHQRRAHRRGHRRATRIGGRSSRSTTSCWPWIPRRSSRSTAPSRSPRSTGRQAALEILDTLDIRGLPRLSGGPGRPAPPGRAVRMPPRSAYERAIELASNPAERAFLRGRRDELGGQARQ